MTSLQFPEPRIVMQDGQASSVLRRINTDSTGFDEAWLQSMLFADLSILPAGSLDPAFSTLIPLAREFPVSAGAVDILAVTPSGLLCIIETKLWRNPEAHRTVLAQVLEYARDLASTSSSDIRAKLAKRLPGGSDLLGHVASFVKNGFDTLDFEEGLEHSLSHGRFLVLVVGDRIRPDLLLLSEMFQSVPHLEFALGLVELSFHRLEDGKDWPLLAVPRIPGRTREEVRAVVRIRYEEKRPELDVEALEATPGTSQTDMTTFLKELPTELEDVYRPYLDKWSADPRFIVFWGQVGFSLRAMASKKVETIFYGYPDNLSVFPEKWLSAWNEAQDAYSQYRSRLEDIAEVQRVFALARLHASHSRMTSDEVRGILAATDRLADALADESRHPTAVHQGKTDLPTFLATLPDEVRPVLEKYLGQWLKNKRLTVYWGEVGFSLRVGTPDGLQTVLLAYPEYSSVVDPNWLSGQSDSDQLFSGYRSQLASVSEVERVYSRGRRYANYDAMTAEELDLLLSATDELVTAMTSEG